MTWENWLVLTTPVLDWFLSLFPSVMDTIMSHPVSGIPVVIMIVGLVVTLSVRFLGALGHYRGSSES